MEKRSLDLTPKLPREAPFVKQRQLLHETPLFRFGSGFHVLFQFRAAFLSAFLRLIVLIQDIFLSTAGLYGLGNLIPVHRDGACRLADQLSQSYFQALLRETKQVSYGNYILEDLARASFPRKRESRRGIPASIEPAPGLNMGTTRKNRLRDRLA